MRHILVVLSVIFLFSLTGCISTYDLDSLALEHYADRIELNENYVFNPRGIFKVESVQKHTAFTSGEKNYSNVVVLKLYDAQYNDALFFINNYAEFQLLDTENTAITDIEPFLVEKDENIYLILQSNEDISNHNFLLITGLKNNQSLIIEMEPEIKSELTL